MYIFHISFQVLEGSFQYRDLNSAMISFISVPAEDTFFPLLRFILPASEAPFLPEIREFPLSYALLILLSGRL